MNEVAKKRLVRIFPALDAVLVDLAEERGISVNRLIVEVVATGIHLDPAALLPQPRPMHRRSDSSAYRSWASMRQRCLNPNATAYEHYGGRGITICDRWNDFENFLVDMGERPQGMTLDRIDVEGGYEPGNCRWATPTQQANNKRAR